jgi:hypothetical protein
VQGQSRKADLDAANDGTLSGGLIFLLQSAAPTTGRRAISIKKSGSTSEVTPTSVLAGGSVADRSRSSYFAYDGYIGRLAVHNAGIDFRHVLKRGAGLPKNAPEVFKHPVFHIYLSNVKQINCLHVC